MDYNFKRAMVRGGVLDKTTFSSMMNFVHLYNDARESGLESSTEIISSLVRAGVTNAPAMFNMVARITGGTIPTIGEEAEFMGAYANYAYETMAENRTRVDALKEEFNNGARFTDGNGNTYSARDLKRAGQKAEKQVSKSKLARFALIAIGAIALSMLLPGLVSGLFVGMVSTATLSTITGISAIAGLIGGGILGKRIYDAGGRKARLDNNVLVRNLYRDNQDLIAEQELEMQNAMARQYELEDAFGIEMDASGHEIGSAYEDIYERFRRDRESEREETTETEVVEEEATEHEAEEHHEEDTETHREGTGILPREEWVDLTDEGAMESFIESLYGPEESLEDTAADAEESEETPAPVVIPAPIIVASTEEEIAEAEAHRDYIERNLYKSTPSDRFEVTRTATNGWVEEVKNPHSNEEKQEALENLRANYAATKHVLNNKKIATAMEQFEDYAIENPEYEDFDSIRMTEALGAISNEYTNLSARLEENRDAMGDIGLIDREEALTHIFRTYAAIKNAQSVVENSTRLNMTELEKQKTAKELVELEKFMHIVIENATQEDVTLEDLNRIINDEYKEVSYDTWLSDFDENVKNIVKNGEKYTYVSYLGCNVELLKIMNLLSTRTIKSSREKQVEDLEVFNSSAIVDGDIEQVEEIEEELVQAEVENEESTDATELASRLAKALSAAAVPTEEDAVSGEQEKAKLATRLSTALNATTATEDKNETKIAGLLTSGENVRRDVAESTTEHENTDFLKQTMFEREKNRKLRELAENMHKQSEYNVEELTGEAIEAELRKIRERVTKESKTLNAAGRYTLLTIENNARKYLLGALNKEDLKTRSAELTSLIKQQAEKYTLYVKVENSSNVGDEKVVYYREIKEGGEKSRRKEISRGSLSSATESGFTSKIRETNPSAYIEDLRDDAAMMQLIEDCTSDYMKVMGKVIKQADDDKKIISQNKKLAKLTIVSALENAIKNGEDPFAAIDKVMSSAYKNLADKANALEIGVLHEDSESQM